MRRQVFTHLGIFSIFVILTIFTFRLYFFNHKVPLPFNLLVFYYPPWKYETQLGYGLQVLNKPLGYDNLKLFYPLRKFTLNEMQHGHIPLWNPFVFSGNVHLATYQSSVFYPLNIFYFIFPTADAWTILIFLQPIFSGWFMFLFLRSLKLSRNASLFGALGFAFSGWMIAMWQEVLVLEHSFLWLPLALYASNLLWEGRSIGRAMMLLILAMTMSVLAGFLQMSIYLFITVFIWNTYRWFRHEDKKRRKSIVFFIGISVVMAMLISAIQWIPALEAYILSARGRVDSANLFQEFLSPFVHLLTFIVPDFWGNPGSYNYFSKIRYIQERTIYVGIYVLIFALVALFKKSKNNQLFWKIFTIVVLSLGFALPTSWIWYFLRIPILSVAQPARIFVLSTFGICVLAAYGMNEWEMHDAWKMIKRILFFFTSIIVVLFLFVFIMRFLLIIYDHMQLFCEQGHMSIETFQFLCQKKQVTAYATISLRNLILPTIFITMVWISFIFFRKQQKFFYIFVYVITIVGSLYYANKILYFSDRKFEFPYVEPIVKLKELSGYNRVWSYGDAYIMRSILSYYGIYSAEGYDALFSHRYGEFINTIKTDGKITDQINRTDVDLLEAGQNESMTKNPRRLRLMSLLGVKYILELKPRVKSFITEEERFPSSLFVSVWENEKWRIWEYKQVLPRAYFAPRYIVEKDRQKIMDHLLDSNFDLHNTIILEDKLEEFHETSEDISMVKITKYESSVVDISVDAKQKGFLFLSDTYYPGWKAFIDGKETKIYRAHYSFRSVLVPSGTHTVRFVYDPLSFKIAITISGISLVAVPFFLLVFRSVKASRFS